MPTILRRHFRELELKILSCTAWKEGSQDRSIISQYITAHA